MENVTENDQCTDNIREHVNKLQHILARITILTNQLNEFGRVSDLLIEKVGKCHGRFPVGQPLIDLVESEEQQLQNEMESKSQTLYCYLKRLKFNEKKVLHHLSSNYNKIFTMIDTLLFPDMYFLGLMEPYIVKPKSVDGVGFSAFATEGSYYPFSCIKRCADNSTIHSYCPPVYIAKRIGQIYPNSQWDANWNTFTTLSDNSIDDRHSYSQHISVTRPYELDATTGYPINPVYKCGIRGYGELPMLGPNHCSCFILYTENDEVCMLQQKTLNGGMYRVLPKAFASRVTDGKLVQDILHNQNILPLSLKRAWVREMPDISADLDDLFSFRNHIDALEAGYLDHPLNTDNAWIELFLWKVKCDEKFINRVADKDQVDSSKFAWIPKDTINDLPIPDFDKSILKLYVKN